jgi:hypothetical protein
MAFFVGLGVLRRTRPQPVRPGRIAVSGILISVAIALSLVGTGGRIIQDPLAIILIPIFIVAGCLIGYYLVQTMTFWKDESTGQLWMRGGAIFAVILVATIVVRFGVRTIVYGSAFGPSTGGFSGSPGSGFSTSGGVSHGLLYDVSADLLFLSLGLWAARAFFLVQRHRAAIPGQPVGS